jgi:NitT/TauT family transport system ATP-binding protein
MNGTTTNADPIVSLQQVHVALGQPGAQVPVLNGLSLDIMPGSFTAIVGPSGCGKTTILNLLADVVAPTSGEVLIKGASPKRTSARSGYMLARDALLPWRSVRKNVELPLEIRGHLSPGRRHEIAQDLIKRVGLAGYESHQIKQLSHGMRQRVSLARVLAFDPDMLLMDEPFSALDAQTRMRAQEFFLEVWARDKKTVLLVTHDIQEAIFMSDEVLVFSSRPATLVGRFPVHFPRPRSIEDMRGDVEFSKLYDGIWGLLKRDVSY